MICLSRICETERADDVSELIFQMKEPRTVLVSYHANDPNAGMSGSRDLNRFKLFLADTGLFTTLMFQDRDFTENVIYDKLLNDRLSANLGYLYENMAAQILASKRDGLFLPHVSE